MRAQDSVLLACLKPFESLEERDWLEIVIRPDAHDDIRRRLDQYGVFDRQLFPDLDGVAKWLRYRVFENKRGAMTKRPARKAILRRMRSEVQGFRGRIFQ